MTHFANFFSGDANPALIDAGPFSVTVDSIMPNLMLYSLTGKNHIASIKARQYPQGEKGLLIPPVGVHQQFNPFPGNPFTSTRSDLIYQL